MIKKILAIIVTLFVAYHWLNENGYIEQGLRLPGFSTASISVKASTADSNLANAIDNQLSDVQVNGTGIVSKTLRDDLNGSRHQRFILRLDDNRTLLVAHNIDLAPKIKSLREGDRVSFYGEYEWNNQGGVVHWTHRDPGGRHVNGWLEHQGKKYD